MTAPLSPPPVTDYRPGYLPAYVANGLIGLRVGKLPFTHGSAIVNGFGGIDPVAQVEAETQVPYPIAGDIHLRDLRLRQAPECVMFHEQSYDFSCGELRTRYTFAIDGTAAHVATLTFCSRSQPTLALQETTVTVDAPVQLTLRAIVDFTGIPGRLLHRATRTPASPTPTVDGRLLWEGQGGKATCGVAYLTEFHGTDEVQRFCDDDNQLAPLSTSYVFQAQPGQRYRLRQYASAVPSTLHPEPDMQAARMAFLGLDTGFDQLQAENQALWQEIWRGRIMLLGAEQRWQAMADASFFYLHTSVHPATPMSTSMFGMTRWHNYHYYRGHVMWDIEIFTVPTFLLTAPDAARSILEYRALRIAAARNNAALYGYQGLQFPWESSDQLGVEVTPLQAKYSVYEQHVTLDVAWAFAQYVFATGDERFLRQYAWPILAGVADWIVSRVTKTARGYEILRITGPVERETPVNNSAYVNITACLVLNAAAEAAERLGFAVDPRWKTIERGFVIPRDPTTGALLSHDDFRSDEEFAGAPEATAGLYPLGYQTDWATEMATYRYYVPLADDFAGTPMLSTFLPVYAARLGERERALEFMERAVADCFFGPFMEYGEFSQRKNPDLPRVGPFCANMGGFLQSCLFGLAGLRLNADSPATWTAYPVILPAGWNEITVERLWVRGQAAQLHAEHGAKKAQITFLASET